MSVVWTEVAQARRHLSERCVGVVWTHLPRCRRPWKDPPLGRTRDAHGLRAPRSDVSLTCCLPTLVQRWRQAGMGVRRSLRGLLYLNLNPSGGAKARKGVLPPLWLARRCVTKRSLGALPSSKTRRGVASRPLTHGSCRRTRRGLELVAWIVVVLAFAGTQHIFNTSFVRAVRQTERADAL